MPAYVRVAKSSEIQPGTAKRIEAGDKLIALFNLDGVFHAIDDACTHRGGPLSEGILFGNEVTCPWHGAVFDVTTGEVISPPAPLGVATYPVRIAGDDVEVEI
jgi:3-phenylpropionate/trans-cinnamate dioxygenase ferredoxin component